MEADPQEVGVNGVQFYSKNGGRNGPTQMVEVSDKICMTQWGWVMYCSSTHQGEAWPSLYEKAFAKWTTQDPTDFPDMGTLNGGDPCQAIAQLTNRNPYYFDTASRTADTMYSIVNSLSANQKTVYPMTAWTYYSDEKTLPGYYDGSNIAANHAYTVLGCATQGNKKYIVLRNPWGWFEPHGVNSYQGLLQFLDVSFWRPINMIDEDGVFALEAESFQHYFACLGVAA